MTIQFIWTNVEKKIRLFSAVVQFLLPATKLGQGNAFTGICDSVHGGSASVHAGIPPPGAAPPPGADPPPKSRACWEIRSTRGRYASYWNAFLLFRRPHEQQF